jgi:hypothetical protein
MPTRPVLIVGVSRRFWSVACVYTVASPNEVSEKIYLVYTIAPLR